jgi:hypothetical protein
MMVGALTNASLKAALQMSGVGQHYPNFVYTKRIGMVLIHALSQDALEVTLMATTLGTILSRIGSNMVIAAGVKRKGKLQTKG